MGQSCQPFLCYPGGQVLKTFPQTKLGTMSYETGFHGDNEAIFDSLYQNDGGYTQIYKC